MEFRCFTHYFNSATREIIFRVEHGRNDPTMAEIQALDDQVRKDFNIAHIISEEEVKKLREPGLVKGIMSFLMGKNYDN